MSMTMIYMAIMRAGNTMKPAPITIMSTARHHGVVYASLAVEVPAIGAKARNTMKSQPAPYIRGRPTGGKKPATGRS
jgi:hypothetical protein